MTDYTKMTKLQKASLAGAGVLALFAVMAPLIFKPKVEPQLQAQQQTQVQSAQPIDQKMLINGQNIMEGSVLLGQKESELTCSNGIDIKFADTIKDNFIEVACGETTKRLICRKNENISAGWKLQIYPDSSVAVTSIIASCISPDAPTGARQQTLVPVGTTL